MIDIIIVLLAWYGALSVRWERTLRKQWKEFVKASCAIGFYIEEEDCR